MAISEREKRRRLKRLTEKERTVLEVVCRHPELQFQEIVAKELIRKDDGQPIKIGTIKSHMGHIYDKLNIESRDRLGLDREYCHLLDHKDTPGPAEKLVQFYARGPIEKLVLMFTSFAAISLIVLVVYAFWPKPAPTIPCENLELAQGIFPQLKDIVLLKPFSDREHSGVFKCEGVRDADSLSVHLSFEDTGEPEQYGFFGVVGFNGLDVSIYSELCVVARAEEDPRNFWLNMKDVTSSTGDDGRVFMKAPPTFGWEEMCVELKQYEDQGVDLSQLENISFGFDNRTGTSEIWIGSLEFK